MREVLLFICAIIVGSLFVLVKCGPWIEAQGIPHVPSKHRPERRGTVAQTQSDTPSCTPIDSLCHLEGVNRHRRLNRRRCRPGAGVGVEQERVREPGGPNWRETLVFRGPHRRP